MDPNLDEMRHARLHRDLNISQVCTTLLVLGFSAIIAFADFTSDEGKLALAVSVGVAYAFLLFNITGTIDEVKATIKDNERNDSALQQYYNKLPIPAYKVLAAFVAIVPAVFQIIWIYA